MLAADMALGLQNALSNSQPVGMSHTEFAAPDSSPVVVPGRWIVEFDGLPQQRNSQQAAAAQLLSRHVGEQSMHVVRSLGGNGTVLIEASPTLSPGALQAALSQVPGFRRVEPDFLVGVTATFPPNDPDFSKLYGLNNTGQTNGVFDADIDAPEAWDITTGSSSLVMGIIDTGIDYLHPDLAASIWVNPGEIAADGIDNDGNGYVDDIHGYDFLNLDADPMDDHRHGTHVAGTIGAVGNNGIGVTGVAWNVQLMALKFLGANGTGPISAAIEALNYATRMRTDFGVNIRATNNSWGGGGFTQPMLDAITASGNAGMLFIAAAMNNASNNDTTPVYPANYASPNVISVAATDHNDNLASFSDYGATTVDLAAPGTIILSTTPNGTYSSFSGTSMATPHVTGAAALAWSLLPNATYQEVRDSLLGSVDAVASLSGKVATGGRLNARRTLEALRFQVTRASGLIVDETGSKATFSVALRSAPVADVTIPVSSNDLTEGTVSTAQLSFTPTNWNQPQIVTITGVDDTALDGDVLFKIVLGTASSMDSAFNGMKPQDVSATNRDNETKFYVVNDAASDRTYEYSPTGNLNESYPLDISNVAPRGVASNAQGTTVWTVDSNRIVYVYNTSGVRLGSWIASGLVNGAQIEGISTSGTDVWLVDAKADKVYRYAGAAARLSGTQSPISSFALNSGNKDPKDLVTDGVSIWVVNDSSTDKVFKYRISDSKLLGSWTITTPGVSSPTGLTIDPTNVRHIWIVDSGTDRVYQYNDTAILISSGYRSASAVFALANGNTNPQGIADPPPASNLLSSAIQASAGTGSVATPLVPPTYASPVASRSLSLFPNTTSELATQYQALSANWSLSNELMNTASKPLTSGSKKATAQLGELLGETSAANVPKFAAADELDGIFEDWSSDPLQLLIAAG
ncbi:MAG: S8 family serine peptidase [Planctomycetaceae bacterium]